MMMEKSKVVVEEVVGKVPSLSIILMITSILIGLVVIVGSIIKLKKGYSAKISVFVWGIFIYIFIGLLLQSFVLAIISQTGLQDAMDKNAYLYALVVAIAAAVFEELARFICFKYIINNRRDNDYNGLMYGVGHGAIEMLKILIPTMISSIALSSMINDGSLTKFLYEVESQDDVDALILSAKDLISGNSFQYLIVPIERIAGFVITISLSSWVWFAVKNKKMKFLPIAMGIHAGVIFLTNSLNEGLKINIYVIELIYIICAAAIAYFTIKMFKQNTDGQFTKKDKITDEQYLM